MAWLVSERSKKHMKIWIMMEHYIYIYTRRQTQCENLVKFAILAIHARYTTSWENALNGRAIKNNRKKFIKFANLHRDASKVREFFLSTSSSRIAFTAWYSHLRVSRVMRRAVRFTRERERERESNVKRKKGKKRRENWQLPNAYQRR